MEVQFTPEQEALLSQIATRHGTSAGQLVKEAALQLLQQDASFREGVERGIAAAARSRNPGTRRFSLALHCDLSRNRHHNPNPAYLVQRAEPLITSHPCRQLS